MSKLLLFITLIMNVIIVRCNYGSFASQRVDIFNLEQSGLRLCFLNGVKLKKYFTWNINVTVHIEQE